METTSLLASGSNQELLAPPRSAHPNSKPPEDEVQSPMTDSITSNDSRSRSYTHLMDGIFDAVKEELNRQIEAKYQRPLRSSEQARAKNQEALGAAEKALAERDRALTAARKRIADLEISYNELPSHIPEVQSHHQSEPKPSEGSIKNSEINVQEKQTELAELASKIRQLQSDNADLGVAFVHLAKAADTAGPGATSSTKLQLRRQVYERLLQNEDFVQKVELLGQSTKITPQAQKMDEETHESTDGMLNEQPKISKCRKILATMSVEYPFFVHSRGSPNLATILTGIRGGAYRIAQEVRDDVHKIKEAAADAYGRNSDEEKGACRLDIDFGELWMSRVVEDDDPDFVPGSLDGSSDMSISD